MNKETLKKIAKTYEEERIDSYQFWGHRSEARVDAKLKCIKVYGEELTNEFLKIK